MEWLETVHSLWRYVVLLTALGAIALALLAMSGSRTWDGVSDRTSFFFTLAMDIQVLIGIGVWVLTEWPRGDTFLTWIHPGLMVAAVGLAHVGRVRSERGNSSRVQGRQALTFFGLSLLLVLVAIPLASWPL